MAYNPISKTVPVYTAAYWLKGYSEGTTTPLAMATDDTGGTTIAKCKINANGYPISSSGDETSVFIPHFNENFKLVLYTNETDADANTTANADWVVDNINYLDNATASSSSDFETGDVIAFFQSAPPTGWTQVATQNNKMMRVVSGTGGGNGGSDSPIAYSQDLSHAHGSSAVGLTIAQLPVHAFPIGSWNSGHVYGQTTVGSASYNAWAGTTVQTTTDLTDTVGSGDTHTHGNTDSTTLTGSWSPSYIDLIIASKDA